jgi:hypothetical protein
MSSSGRGHGFERKIAKMLSLWWSSNKDDNVFYRSQSSGARATQRNKQKKDTKFQHGDICPSSSEGEALISIWHVECKIGYGKKNKNSIKKWDVLDLIDSQQKIPTIMSFWEQCKDGADLTKREPILIFARNGRVPCITIRTEYRNELITMCGKNYNDGLFINHNLYIMRLENFLEWIDPEVFIKK